MASPKQLRKLLQEKQEPFTLEVYLVERGYLNKIFSSELSNSTKLLKKSAAIYGINKRRKIIPKFSMILRVVFHKLLYFNSKLMKKNYGGDKNLSVIEKGMNIQEIAEEDEFSSSSSTTVFNSCSESSTEDAYDSSEKCRISTTPRTCHGFKLGNLGRELAGTTKRHFKWGGVKDNKQLSPESVLEEIHFDDERGLQFQEIIGPDEMICIQLCENMCAWSRKSMDETKTAQLLNLNLLASAEEWGYFMQQTEIGIEIGDAILEEIRNEIIMDIIKIV